ncbi:SigE family RNA polymerase sigma factor [Phytohabitans aurantiacus]|nr:hypothetical protein [Phytohabitans aurantiacus]
MPRMGTEPPPEYVAFVERHLDALRRESARVVGDEHDADLLYPDVLADVAGRWRWLELSRVWLGETRAADLYLARSFARRSERWQPPQLGPVEVEVLVGPGDAAPAPYRMPPPWSSVALRLASQVSTTRRPEARPLAEAAVAWWHAYEHRRHRKHVAAGIAVALLVVLMIRVPQELDATAGQHPLIGRVSAVDVGHSLTT